jgi:hypothetical protein
MKTLARWVARMALVACAGDVSRDTRLVAAVFPLGSAAAAHAAAPTLLASRTWPDRSPIPQLFDRDGNAGDLSLERRQRRPILEWSPAISRDNDTIRR